VSTLGYGSYLSAFGCRCRADGFPGVPRDGSTLRRMANPLISRTLPFLRTISACWLLKCILQRCDWANHLTPSGVGIGPCGLEANKWVSWHQAHTTWFFETFVLRPFLPDYKPFCEEFRSARPVYRPDGRQLVAPFRLSAHSNPICVLPRTGTTPSFPFRRSKPR
jgi:hypothetical protein